MQLEVQTIIICDLKFYFGIELHLNLSYSNRFIKWDFYKKFRLTIMLKTDTSYRIYSKFNIPTIISFCVSLSMLETQEALKTWCGYIKSTPFWVDGYMLHLTFLTWSNNNATNITYSTRVRLLCINLLHIILLHM